MPSRLLAIAACAASTALGALAAPPAFAQAQPEGAKSAVAKSAKATVNAPARQAITTATGTSPVKPAATAQSKAPESAAKAADSWKSECHHGKDSDA